MRTFGRTGRMRIARGAAAGAALRRRFPVRLGTFIRDALLLCHICVYADLTGVLGGEVRCTTYRDNHQAILRFNNAKSPCLRSSDGVFHL